MYGNNHIYDYLNNKKVSLNEDLFITSCLYVNFIT